GLLLPLFRLLFACLVCPLLLFGLLPLRLLLLHLLFLLLAPFVCFRICGVWLPIRRVWRHSRRIGVRGVPVRFRSIGVGVRVRLCIRRRVCIRGRAAGVWRPV